MTKIKITNDGYNVELNGKAVVVDARTKDDAYNQACSISASLSAIGVKSVILNSRGAEI